jgi:hypothetical protein
VGRERASKPRLPDSGWFRIDLDQCGRRLSKGGGPDANAAEVITRETVTVELTMSVGAIA